MKHSILLRFASCFILACAASCGMQTKEVFTINPDLSGKCVIEVKMYIDTTSVDAKLALKDSLYGITPTLPNFHKAKFTRRDAINLSLKFIRTKGVEVWNSIRFGMSKKRDMIFFSGIAYFRDVEQVHFSMLDSLLKVTKGTGNQVTFQLVPHALKKGNPVSDDDANKTVSELRKNAFYERPVLADILNPTEATVIYNLPGTITNSAVYGQQGDNIVQLTLTGNEIMRYADSISRSQQLAVEDYKENNGTWGGIMEPLFNSIVWGSAATPEVTFTKGKKDLFDYNTEVQSAMGFFDDFMRNSRLEKYDSTNAAKEGKEESKRPEEYGMLVVNKADSVAKKPYFKDMTAIQSNDTITFSGELSEDVKAGQEAKVHIMKLVVGADLDMADSIVAHTKISATLMPEKVGNSDKAPKRKVSFMFVVRLPKGCKEIAVQGRISTTLEGKPGVQIPFKMKQIAVTSAKHLQ